MSESKKQTYLATIAIIISVLSLLTTIIIATNEENIEVIVDDISVSAIDNGVAKCDITVIVANTSHSTTSLIDAEIYTAYVGLRASEKIENAYISDLPITILQGGANRVTVTCEYPLDIEDQNALAAGEQLSVVLKNQMISIRFYSAKQHMYSSIARFENAEQNY